MLTQEELKRLFIYDKKTGYFTRRVTQHAQAPAGSLFGWLHHKGYLVGKVHGQYFALHRLAFLYVVGEMPVEVDHRNGVKNDNRWKNLRPANREFNTQNSVRAMRTNKSTGLLGAYPSPGTGRFKAVLRISKMNIYMGTFNSAERAHAEYLWAKRALHAGCTI